MELYLDDKVLNDLLDQVSELQLKIDKRIDELHKIGAFCGQIC